MIENKNTRKKKKEKKLQSSDSLVCIMISCCSFEISAFFPLLSSQEAIAKLEEEAGSVMDVLEASKVCRVACAKLLLSISLSLFIAYTALPQSGKLMYLDLAMWKTSSCAMHTIRCLLHESNSLFTFVPSKRSHSRPMTRFSSEHLYGSAFVLLHM